MPAPQLDPAVGAQFWQDPAAFATPLLMLYLARFGTAETAEFSRERPAADSDRLACIDWLPETIELEIADAWGRPPAAANLERLLAALALLRSDDFWRDESQFIAICNHLSGEHYDPALWNPATALEIAWGITEALIIAPPPPDDPEPCSPAVRRYIGLALRREGFVEPPDVLRLGLGQEVARDQFLRDFAAHPEVTQAAAAIQEERRQALNATIVAGLRQLLDQCATLGFTETDARQLLARLTQDQPGA